MTKGQIVELIQRSHEPRLRYQVVEKLLDLVFNQPILPLFAKDPSNLDLYAKRYDNISTTGGFSMLPASTIQFMDAANGVRQIYAPAHRDIRFVPVKEGQIDVFDALEVGMIDPTVGYIQKHDRVFYTANIPEYVDTVSMNIVVVPSGLDDNDEFILPAGFDQAQLIAAFMSKVPPEEKINQ